MMENADSASLLMQIDQRAQNLVNEVARHEREMQPSPGLSPEHSSQGRAMLKKIRDAADSLLHELRVSNSDRKSQEDQP